MEFKFYNVIPVYPVLLYDYKLNYVDVKYPLIRFNIAEFKLVSVIDTALPKFTVVAPTAKLTVFPTIFVT